MYSWTTKRQESLYPWIFGWYNHSHNGEIRHHSDRTHETGTEIEVYWCRKENVNVNPEKIPQNEENWTAQGHPAFLVVTYFTSEAKYLDLNLDTNLTWIVYLPKTTNKGKMTSTAAKQAVGKTFGLNPHMVYWPFVAVVRPIISYSSLL